MPAEPSPIVGAHPWVNRIVVATLGLFAMRLVFETRVKVYEYVLTYGWAILGAAFGPQVILALFWKRASWAGCLAGMLTGFLIALIWPNVYDEAATGVHVYNLPLAFVAALIVNIVVSLVVPGPARAEARS